MPKIGIATNPRDDVNGELSGNYTLKDLVEQLNMYNFVTSVETDVSGNPWYKFNEVIFSTPWFPDQVIRLRRDSANNTGTIGLDRGQMKTELNPDETIRSKEFVQIESVFSSDGSNRSPQKIYLYVGRSCEYFCIYWERTTPTDFSMIFFGKTSNPPNPDKFCMFELPELKGIRLLNFVDSAAPKQSRGYGVFAQRPISRGGTTCTAPIIITTPDNEYIGMLKEIDNACITTADKTLIDNSPVNPGGTASDNYDLIRLNSFDVNASNEHLKNTAIRLVY